MASFRALQWCWPKCFDALAYTRVGYSLCKLEVRNSSLLSLEGTLSKILVPHKMAPYFQRA